MTQSFELNPLPLNLLTAQLKYACYFSWVQTNYPVYYRKFREVSDPAAAFAWQKLTVAGNFIAEITKPARDYLNVKIPELLEKVSFSCIFWYFLLYKFFNL